MKNRLIRITSMFAAVIVLATVLLINQFPNEKSNDDMKEYIVDLNEIEQLSKQSVTGDQFVAIQDRIDTLQKKLQQSADSFTLQSSHTEILYIYMGICLIFLVLVFLYVYDAILRPFDLMKQYAKEIANGNFDLPLDYERSNYFGEFTWAFDHMRCEIKKSRACEHEAIENNKTVIATLSHDIKTPIASIRAYAEGLEACLDNSVEKRAHYTKVMMKKCDEVAHLTDDLFLHSLSDLDKLQMTMEETELISILPEIITDMDADKKDIMFHPIADEIYVEIDHKRFVQILENLVNNARKYAKTKIDISLQKQMHDVVITIRDYGKGIPDEDMPFIFEKFYRGHNHGEEPGSGLGLYITRYIVTQMQGDIMLHNHANGLEITITLPLVEKN